MNKQRTNVACSRELDALAAPRWKAVRRGLVWPVTLTLAAMWTVKLFSRFLWCRIPQPSMARFLALAAVAPSATEAKGVTEPHKRSPFQRDTGEWFKGRLPKVHMFYSWTGWMLLSMAYVIATSLENDGNLQAIPDAILRLAVIAPVFLQVFWIPGGQVQRLMLALSQDADVETGHLG